MIILGITGNMGSGKSLAAAYLAELGAAVIDADRVGHSILLKGQKAYGPLIDAFGDAFLGPDGEIDRRALGEYVFGDRSGQRRMLLNSITHPLIRQEINGKIGVYAAQGYLLTVIEAAVLFEGEMTVLMDKIWLISAPRNQLIERVTNRDHCGEDEVLLRLGAQMSEAEMAKRVDLIIENDGTPEQFRKKLQHEYNKLLKERS
jgi:dephospho-CoA kinase